MAISVTNAEPEGSILVRNLTWTREPEEVPSVGSYRQFAPSATTTITIEVAIDHQELMDLFAALRPASDALEEAGFLPQARFLRALHKPVQMFAK